MGEAVKKAAEEELDLDQKCRDFVNRVLNSLAEMGILKQEFATISNLKQALSEAPIRYGGKPPRPNVAAQTDGFSITTFEPFINLGTNRIAAMIHEGLHLWKAGGATDVGLARAANARFEVVPGNPQRTQDNASSAFQADLEKQCGPQ